MNLMYYQDLFLFMRDIFRDGVVMRQLHFFPVISEIQRKPGNGRSGVITEMMGKVRCVTDKT